MSLQLASLNPAAIQYSCFIVHPQTYRSLVRARDFMRQTYQRPVKLSDISARANLSPYHFLRVYKRAYGETPHEFVTRLRIERAKTLLVSGEHNVTEACFEIGFSSLGSFSGLFARYVGLSPSEYRRYARPGISVPRGIRPLFVPACFSAMFYEPMIRNNRNFREAGHEVPLLSSRQDNDTGG